MFSRDEILSSKPIVRSSAIDPSIELEIDLAQAQRFLDFLGGEDSRFFFIVMNDEKNGRVMTRTYPNALLEEVALKLVGKNRKGAGVFVAVNEIIGDRRLLSSVGEIRAVIRELDKDCEKELPIKQSMRVCSSPGHYHDYWLLDFEDKGAQNMTGSDFTAIQRRLVKDWGSDKGVIDATRVLRLPGFYHQKKRTEDGNLEPHRVEFEVYDGGALYTYSEIVEAFPPIVSREEPIASYSGDFDGERLRPFFEALDPNVDYHDWLRTGMILHWASKGSAEGLALWDSISSEWRAYEAGVCEVKWRTFHEAPGSGGTATLETLKGMLADQGADAVAGDLAAFLAAEEFDDGFVYNTGPVSRGKPKWGIQKFLDDDPLLEYLGNLDLIDPECKDPWIPIRCLWADQHKTGQPVAAAVSPLYRGKQPDRRGYRCKAKGCNHKTQDFLDKLFADYEGTDEPFMADGRLEFAQKRYALVEAGQLVVDLWRKPQDFGLDEGVKLGDWKAARSYKTHVGYEEGEDGLKPVYQMLGLAWQNAQLTRRLFGLAYRPDLPRKRVFRDNGELFYNQYLPPYQEQVPGEPEEFLSHCQHIIPSETERKVFLDWLAYKVQHPERRSYAVVMVADTSTHSVEPPPGKKKARFGVGRSLLGDMIAQVLQQGVRRLDLEEFVNRDGQAAYNEWAVDTQMVIIEEAHGDAPRHGNEGARVEAHLRTLIDSRPVRNTRIKIKYGSVQNRTVYYNVLIFTNHADALRIPEQDRRFFVLKNANWQRQDWEYSKFAQAIEDPIQVGQVYTWLRGRDLSGFDPNRPPMTESKAEMTNASVRMIDEDIQILLDRLPGDLVIKRQLVDAALEIIREELYDPDGKAARALMSRVDWIWRKTARHLVDIKTPGNERGARMKLDEKSSQPDVVRALRNVPKWAKIWEVEGVKSCRLELQKNNREIEDSDLNSPT